MSNEELFRVEAICTDCDTFLMGSAEKPHLTLEELGKKWIMIVASAPLNAPRCPKCGYSTYNDTNSHFKLLVDNGSEKLSSHDFWEQHK